MPPSRRRVLELASAALATGLAGCAIAADPAREPTVTPAPVPSDAPTSATRSRARQMPSPSDVGFDVTVRSGFTESSPARLGIAFWNAGDTLLTALDGPAYSLPFVDDDYAAPDATDEPALMLVPDDAKLAIDPDGSTAGPVGAFLPTEPTDGCWSLPFNWPEAQGVGTLTLRAVPLAPGHRREHPSSCYFVGDCAPGTYRFVNTFDLAAGDPPAEPDLVRARTSFDLHVSAAMDVEVRVHAPAIEPPTRDE